MITSNLKQTKRISYFNQKDTKSIHWNNSRTLFLLICDYLKTQLSTLTITKVLFLSLRAILPFD